MSKNLNKAELVMLVAMQTGYDKTTIQNVIESAMHNVRKQMATGKNLQLRGFGSFVVKERKEKIARNLQNNTSVVIPAHKTPTFKPSDAFIDMLNK